MKWSTFIVTALTITCLISLGLFTLFNPPTVAESELNSPKISVTDVVFDQYEKSEIEAEIKKSITQVQTCQKDNDCMKTHYGCPFGCSSLVNKTNHEHILKLKSAYSLAGGSYCMYRCGVPASETTPACIDNICTLVGTIDGQSNIRQFIKNQSNENKINP